MRGMISPRQHASVHWYKLHDILSLSDRAEGKIDIYICVLWLLLVPEYVLTVCMYVCVVCTYVYICTYHTYVCMYVNSSK